LDVLVIHAEVVKASALVSVACAEDDDFHTYGLTDGAHAVLPRLGFERSSHLDALLL
jgi:hypothetical protein